jgi:hypothetical protein
MSMARSLLLRACAVLVLSVAVAGCAAPGNAPATVTAPLVATSAPLVAGSFPNVHTPGEVAVTDVRQVCPSTQAARRVTARTLRTVAGWYGVALDLPPGFEWDHRLPHSLGGSDGPANIWPQPPDVPNPRGFILNRKDRIEANAHRDVCAGRMTLAAAQRMFLGDWRPLLR